MGLAHPVIAGITNPVQMSLVNAVHISFLENDFSADF